MAESSPLSNPNPVVVHQPAASMRVTGEPEDALVSEVFGELKVGQRGGSCTYSIFWTLDPPARSEGSEVQITIHNCSYFMILRPVNPP